MSQPKYPNVSVIVPIYNAQKYIGGCIKSILSQTLDDFELLLVDDGSTDKSGIICDGFAEKDGRITVIHQENGGEMSARAAGIRISKAPWLCFIDADDTIAPDALETMSRHVCDEVDIVVFEQIRNCTLSMTGYASYLLEFHGWTMWGKLFRRSLFDEYSITVPRYFKVGEDFLTQLRLLRNIKGKVIVQTESKYLYNTSNPGSVQLSHRKNYEYEKRVIGEATQSIQMIFDHDRALQEAFFHWKLIYLGGMIGLRYDIPYTDTWICDVVQESKTFNCSMKERLILKSISVPPLRLMLICEKAVKSLVRRILNKL